MVISKSELNKSYIKKKWLIRTRMNDIRIRPKQEPDYIQIRITCTGFLMAINKRVLIFKNSCFDGNQSQSRHIFKNSCFGTCSILNPCGLWFQSKIVDPSLHCGQSQETVSVTNLWANCATVAPRPHFIGIILNFYRCSVTR
jgi:hypothetical protein